MNTLLLAIVAAALVVLVALLLRPMQHDEQPQPEEDERVSPLLRGINYLLSDKPDLALQEMVQVARLRSEAADVYMALGEMFRAKGEFGRAVRIHQNLLARPDLPKSMHLQANLALATDFQMGGLLDRALVQYQKVLDMQSDHAGALEASLRIREQSREWQAAEELLSRLERVRNCSYSSHRAYLFSEMARQALKSDDLETAAADAARALELDPACAPARMVEIDLALRSGRADDAAQGLTLLWEQAREHFPLVIPLLLAHEDFYRERGEALLMQLWQAHGDSELALAWLEALAARRSVAEAEALQARLQFSPASLRESLRLHAVLGEADDPHSRFARQWRKTAKNYACESCGVEVVEVRWQCPQCHAWGTLHPKSEEKI